MNKYCRKALGWNTFIVFVFVHSYWHMAEVNKYVKGRPTEMKKCLNSGLYEQGFEATKTMYLVGEGVILVGNQQDGGKKRQISTPVSAFSAIVGVSLKCVL